MGQLLPVHGVHFSLSFASLLYSFPFFKFTLQFYKYLLSFLYLFFFFNVKHSWFLTRAKNMEEEMHCWKQQVLVSSKVPK